MKRSAATVLLALLAACQAAGPGAINRPSVPGDHSALSTMERIAVAAQQCWFSGKDPAFKAMKLSPDFSALSVKRSASSVSPLLSSQ